MVLALRARFPLRRKNASKSVQIRRTRRWRQTRRRLAANSTALTANQTPLTADSTDLNGFWRILRRNETLMHIQRDLWPHTLTQHGPLTSCILRPTHYIFMIMQIKPHPSLLFIIPHEYSWRQRDLWRHISRAWSLTSPILPPLSGPTCIIYGRFPALFGRPFCIALSANQILSAPTCISYGRFPALFGRFFCSIETSREPRLFTIAPSFEIVLTSQTIRAYK